MFALMFARGCERLCLETGTGAPATAAHALFPRNGFGWTRPFGDDVATEFNVFMEKRLRCVEGGVSMGTPQR
jgi:hypothetical protein